jgi:hypothetical protein
MEGGNILLSAISDGTFVARPGSLGEDATAEGHGDLFDRRGQGWLPIGCFLVRSGDRWVLVDAGMGPTESSAGDQDDPCRLFGGQLPVGLRALGSSGTTSPRSSVPTCTPTTRGGCSIWSPGRASRARASGWVRATGAT